MKPRDKQGLFSFMLDRVDEVSTRNHQPDYIAFVRWFVDMAYQEPRIYHTDGHRDGKVDAFFQTAAADAVAHYVVNAKLSRQFNKLAPVSFYDEILAYHYLFAEATPRQREDHLQGVLPALRDHYSNLFSLYDEGSVELLFITDCRANRQQFKRANGLSVTVYHLEDLLQFLLDDLELAMPKTPSLVLEGVANLLMAREEETEVATTIVFARVIDFIRYMKKQDPFHLLFARNVRLYLGETPVNLAIADTFKSHPSEFVYSNNGITLICDEFVHTSRELTINNPRVVNGSQTLHSVKDVPEPSADARVMVRLIKLPPLDPDDPEDWARRRREIINRISVRSNQQNPIKKWDLVANDDFQLELFRFFRDKKVFYERRQKEWSERSRELSGSAMRRGPSVKKMAQLVASYRYADKHLGPARAKSSPAQLFDDAAYRKIARVPPELAFQLYALNEITSDAFRLLPQAKYQVLGGYIEFALFALVCRAMTDAGARWGAPELTGSLSAELDARSGTRPVWRNLVALCSMRLHSRFQEERRSYRAIHGKDLTIANFFKASGYVDKAIGPAPTATMRATAKDILSKM